jgi:molecular chaperone GrpE (heat shock protein)
MKEPLSNLPGQNQPEPLPEGANTSPERAIQALRLELQAREETIQHLKQEIERLRFQQETQVKETSQARFEALFTDLASAVPQILTQADLLENRGKDVQARDVLVVARRIVRALERHGLELEGQAGQQVIFDPLRHQPLDASSQPQSGQTVTIRFAGVSYQGKILKKALIEG